MILIGNQMVYLPKGSGNYKDLDKTRVKLFPNFTSHHLITHTYFSTSNKRLKLKGTGGFVDGVKAIVIVNIFGR